MGLDLKILPKHISAYLYFSHDVITLQRDYKLFDIIQNIEDRYGRKVHRDGLYSYVGKVEGYDDTCYGKTTETSYGKIMKGILAKELKEGLKNYKTSSWKNKSFISFLKELPDEIELFLFWC